MSDRPRRPILTLKPRAAPPPSLGSRWKCKPCGALVEVSGLEAPTDEIRCPTCNAKLGLGADFQASPPPRRIRARRVPD